MALKTETKRVEEGLILSPDIRPAVPSTHSANAIRAMRSLLNRSTEASAPELELGASACKNKGGRGPVK